jgi:hypothetical protein
MRSLSRGLRSYLPLYPTLYSVVVVGGGGGAARVTAFFCGGGTTEAA